ncbi:MAG TPA: hypothetical protein VFA06_02240 [Actinocrinis sp.]|uniref:hypothetical protein n=1 Tax=Actinocrinis sp. TaxID=1920516 RepID=UPI002D58306F|nr:hypothetical protein [Actinocrinis sp.]HZU54668.1 hypothetical protein [Actinocrinis sp.]
MNAAEDRLSELMDAATCALDPPIDDILAAGERLGRARKRRRHIAVAAGTAVVVLLAGAGVAVGMGDPDFGGDYDAAGHVNGPSHPAMPIPDPLAPSGTTSPVPSPTSTGPFGFDKLKPGPGETPINATAAVNILRKLVAANWKFGDYKPASRGSLLRVDVDDGRGISQIFVGIAPVGSSSMDPVDCSLQGLGLPRATPSSGAKLGLTGLRPISECYVESNTVTGDTAMLEVIAPSASNVVTYRVIVNRRDGVAVEITAQNGDPGSAATEVTRALPPLNVEQWGFIASSPMWQPYVPVSFAE